jgi:uncharacterized protein
MDALLLPFPALLTCLVLGGLAGLFGGLIGIGGGFILVPGFFYLFSSLFGLSPDAAIRFALGTAMASILITATFATHSHSKYKVVLWPFFKSIAPTLVIGVLCGVFLATQMEARYVKIAFAAFCVYSGFRMLFVRPKVVHLVQAAPTVLKASPYGVFFGALCGLIGVGGANVLVPFLLKRGAQMREAMATSSSLQLPIGLTGLVAYVVSGYSVHHEALQLTFGYVSVPVFLSSGVAIALFTPIGVKLSHALPVGLLKRMFGLVALGIGLHMMGVFQFNYPSIPPVQSVTKLNPPASATKCGPTQKCASSSSKHAEHAFELLDPYH